MIKVSLNLEISLSKIFLGFSGLPVAVGSFNHFSSNKIKQIRSESRKVVISDAKDKKAVSWELVKSSLNDKVHSIYNLK